MEGIQFRAMNTDIVLQAEGTADQLRPGFEAASQYIQDCECRFTRFSPDSELSHLNNAGGAWVQVSPELFEIILVAREFMQKTGGLFNPAILPNLQRIGYDRSMDLLRMEEDSAAPVAAAFQAINFDDIQIRPEDYQVSLPMGAMLDLGGIAKGWIAEKAAGLLNKYSPACGVSAGGDMFLIGKPEGRETWSVDLENPSTPADNLVRLNLPPGAVATSSISKRVWKQNGVERHHLIDPRTGEPAQTEWLSVTVIAPHACEAEVYAKALLIAGQRSAHQLALNEDISYLAVDRHGQILGTKKSLEFIHEFKYQDD